MPRWKQGDWRASRWFRPTLAWRIGEPPPGFELPEDSEPDELIVEPAPGGGKRIKQQHGVQGHRFYHYTPAGEPEHVRVWVDAESTSNLGHQFGVYLRFGGTRQDPTTYLLRSNGASAQLVKIVSGTVTELATLDISVSANTKYRLELQVYEGRLKAKFYPVSGGTNDWLFDITDSSITAAGKIGMYAHNSNGTRYFYGFGYQALTIDPDLTAPATPTGLQATSGDTQVTLSWDASDTATGYKLRQDGVVIYTGSDLERVVTGLTNGVTYSFTVSASNAAGESAESAAVSGTPAAIQVPEFVSATSGGTGSSSSTSTTISKPANVQEGDLLIAAMQNNQAHTSITPPTGWTFRIQPQNATHGLAVYTKVATASEPAEYTWTHGSATSNGVIYAARHVDSDVPFAGVSIESGGSTSRSTPSLYAKTSNCLLVGIHGMTAVSSRTWTAPTEMVKRAEAGFSVSVMICDQSLTAIGPTGNRTATASDTGVAESILLALRPAGAQSVLPEFGKFRLQGYRNNGDASFVGVLEFEVRTEPGGSNVATGGTASASGEISGLEAAKAFDGLLTSGNGWAVQNNNTWPVWLQYERSALVIVEYRVGSYATSTSTAVRSLKDWNFQVEIDGAWSSLDARTRQTGWTFGEMRTFSL